ncbi:MAG: hypothetical protein NUV46_03885 [Nanoarchaeota archaeon]|nr:hypothetical protein [Nanoarchaeota archaeon]
MSKRKDDLIRKFEEKKRVYLMVLGGATEEDALNFDIIKYAGAIRKKHSELTQEDKKLMDLGFSFVEGNLKIKDLPKDKVPHYFNVLKNVRDTSRANLANISNDPVYSVLKNLNNKIAIQLSETRRKSLGEEIHEEDLEEEHILYQIGQKQEFVRTLVNFMETRYSFNDKEPLDPHDFDGERPLGSFHIREWDVDARLLTDKEYSLLRNFLVDSRNKENNLEKFVSLLPSAPWERFYWDKLEDLDFKRKQKY